MSFLTQFVSSLYEYLDKQQHVTKMIAGKFLEFENDLIYENIFDEINKASLSIISVQQHIKTNYKRCFFYSKQTKKRKNKRNNDESSKQKIQNNFDLSFFDSQMFRLLLVLEWKLLSITALLQSRIIRKDTENFWVNDLSENEGFEKICNETSDNFIEIIEKLSTMSESCLKKEGFRERKGIKLRDYYQKKFSKVSKVLNEMKKKD
ncbi:hypothetical protein M0812_18779 [Anaeramoeba flamelloides]|uniref:Uncharacterized protein n=1 Tax=Anaeramoeba flamelloides TaxID=1746091 RepID=A0AAV7Z6E2_9EUKA|nr:hypothetical protein M0812_18779 [Anaeramoeba flamelloides]